MSLLVPYLLVSLAWCPPSTPAISCPGILARSAPELLKVLPFGTAC